MSKPTIQVPVVWDAANRRKDKSISIRMSTITDVDTVQFATMDRFVNTPGWLQYVPNASGSDAIPDIDIPRENVNEAGIKTPSQRLRAVLFVLWREEGEPGIFADYYRREMEVLITTLKQQLPERGQ